MIFFFTAGLKSAAATAKHDTLVALENAGVKLHGKLHELDADGDQQVEREIA